MSFSRKLVAEFVGTALLVIVAVGVATLSFGFDVTGTVVSAGVVATALAFGLVLLALVYALGPISGCHVNPAVTMGFLVTGRMGLADALRYWLVQILGGIAGALVLWGIFSGAPGYSRRTTGLGADGFGPLSLVHLDATGAFGTEVVLTLLFVFVVLAVTSRVAAPGFAGLAIGLALTVVHLIGIPLTGTSVNPARSIGPALLVGGQALSQLWLFIVAPLVGAVLAALLYRYFHPHEQALPRTTQMESIAVPVSGDTDGAVDTGVAGDADPVEGFAVIAAGTASLQPAATATSRPRTSQPAKSQPATSPPRKKAQPRTSQPAKSQPAASPPRKKAQPRTSQPAKSQPAKPEPPRRGRGASRGSA